MTSTRINLPAQRIQRLADASDLAIVLFSGNRNQQHAFLVIWLTLKQTRSGFAPDFVEPCQRFGVSRRTLERTRAKLRRLGLIERVSRFNARFGGREGWVLSSRFESGLRHLADSIAALRRGPSDAEKDQLLLNLADARRSVRNHEPEVRTP